MGNEKGTLLAVVQWTQMNGDVSALSRLRMMVLPLTVKEGIIFDRVDGTTKCSPQYLDAVRDAASKIVGKECPR